MKSSLHLYCFIEFFFSFQEEKKENLYIYFCKVCISLINCISCIVSPLTDVYFKISVPCDLRKRREASGVEGGASVGERRVLYARSVSPVIGGRCVPSTPLC